MTPHNPIPPRTTEIPRVTPNPYPRLPQSPEPLLPHPATEAIRAQPRRAESDLDDLAHLFATEPLPPGADPRQPAHARARIATYVLLIALVVVILTAFTVLIGESVAP